MKNHSFSKRLRYYRNKKKLTVKEMAAAIEVPITTYREWENGRSVSGEPYEKIAEVLDISLLELITGESSNPNKILQQVDDIQERLVLLKKNLISYCDS
jgi:transcriptional regulator with XRE-family HTH domain